LALRKKRASRKNTANKENPAAAPTKSESEHIFQSVGLQAVHGRLSTYFPLVHMNRTAMKHYNNMLQQKFFPHSIGGRLQTLCTLNKAGTPYNLLAGFPNRQFVVLHRHRSGGSAIKSAKFSRENNNFTFSKFGSGPGRKGC
jgi:hypothetical protein